MKKFSILLMTFALIIIFQIVILLSPVNAEETLKFSCSAQMLEAFGTEILDEFKKDSGINLKIYKSSSNAAINRMMNGYSDIAGSMEGLKYNDKQSKYIQIQFCKDNLAVITGLLTKVKNLSESQLQGIFSKNIKNWKELGGQDENIIVIVPEIETAAYQNFQKQAMKGRHIEHDFMSSQSSDVIDAVIKISGGISFITQGAVGKKRAVKTININGFSPKDEQYPYYQTMYFITKENPKNMCKKFINFFQSRHGTSVNNNIIPMFR